MKNGVVLNCVCLSVNTDSYSVIYFYNGLVQNSGGWINTIDNLITILEEWCFGEWKEEQIYIRITDYKDEEDIRFTMRVYDQLLKCGVDVLLLDSEGEGD